MAKIYLLRRDLATATKYADEVIKDSPKNSDAHFTKGEIYMLKGEGANAVTEFRSVVSENEKFTQGQIRLAEAHLLNKAPALALDVLKTAIKVQPDARVFDWIERLALSELCQEERLEIAGQLKRALVSGYASQASPLLAV